MGRVLVVVLSAMAVFVGQARAAVPAGFYEAVKLEPAATFVAGKPVTVSCAKTDAVWQAYVASFGGRADGVGSAPVGGTDVHFAPAVCVNLLEWLRGRSRFVPGFAASLQVFTHEAIHSRGERDEGVTDCAAMHEMPRVGVRFMHVKAGMQLRAVMASAWKYHRTHGPSYLTVC